MKTSQTTGAIGAALAKAQSAMGSADRDGHNSHYGNSYASLGSLLRVAKSACSANGIAIVQSCETLHVETGPIGIVVSRLLHSSGEWIEGEVSLSLEKVAAQELGKVLTYLRRYALAALVGIVSDEDDDGETDLQARASAPPRAPAPRPPAKRKADPSPTAAGGEVEFEGLIDDVRKTPVSNGGVKFGVLVRSWEHGWASTFDETMGHWLSLRVGKACRLKVKQAGKFWNVVDAVEVTPSGGEVSPTADDIPF